MHNIHASVGIAADAPQMTRRTVAAHEHHAEKQVARHPAPLQQEPAGGGAASRAPVFIPQVARVNASPAQPPLHFAYQMQDAQQPQHQNRQVHRDQQQQDGRSSQKRTHAQAAAVHGAAALAAGGQEEERQQEERAPKRQAAMQGSTAGNVAAGCQAHAHGTASAVRSAHAQQHAPPEPAAGLGQGRLPVAAEGCAAVPDAVVPVAGVPGLKYEAMDQQAAVPVVPGAPAQDGVPAVPHAVLNLVPHVVPHVPAVQPAGDQQAAAQQVGAQQAAQQVVGRQAVQQAGPRAAQPAERLQSAIGAHRAQERAKAAQAQQR